MSRKYRAKLRIPKLPNEQARALFARAGTANVAIAVDTRPKIVPTRKPESRSKAKADLRGALLRGSDLPTLTTCP